MADGSTTKLSQYRGKVVLVAFLNTGCSHCQAFAKQLSLYQQEYGTKGVQVIEAVFDKEAKQGLEKFRSLFVDFRLKTELLKGECGSQPADAATDDRDLDHSAEIATKGTKHTKNFSENQFVLFVPFCGWFSASDLMCTSTRVWMPSITSSDHKCQ